MAKNEVIQKQLDLLQVFSTVTKQRQLVEDEAYARQRKAHEDCEKQHLEITKISPIARSHLRNVKLSDLWPTVSYQPEDIADANPEHLLWWEKYKSVHRSLSSLDRAISALCRWQAARARALRLTLAGALVVLAILGYAGFKVFQDYFDGYKILLAQRLAITAVQADQPRPADGMVMIWVPAGEFQMGSEDWDDDERPVNTVALDGFWIDRTEVTNVQYQGCVAARVCNASFYANNNDTNGDTQPVVGVSWQDAVAYCTWVGGRLPTEAEWEYAARGPESLTYPWGNDWRIGLANCDEDDCQDGYETTAPVGIFPENASWVGALDMAGNVWEWVADWYGDYPSERQENPTGPANGIYRVLRGGSWASSAEMTRCSFRDKMAPGTWYNDRGFRCALTAP